VTEIIEKIYEPSVIAFDLFNDKFIDYIKQHNDTNWYQILLGYDI